MMTEKNTKTYIAKSKIEEAGKGLFAKCAILPGEIVAVFEENENKSKQYRDYTISDGDLIFNYNQKCNANFANDIIKVSSLKEIYYNILNGKPIIEKHEDLELNALIQSIDDPESKLVIIATKNIYPDEEIYVHYGLQYWLSWNLCPCRVSVLKFFETILDKKEKALLFPKCINESQNAKQSISEYVKTFYDPKSDWEISGLNLRIFHIDGKLKHENIISLQKILLSDGMSLYHFQIPINEELIGLK